MKKILKIILVIGIAIAIFGAANVKSFLNKGVDVIENGTQKLKDSEVFDKYSSEIKQSIADGAGDFINKKLGK